MTSSTPTTGHAGTVTTKNARTARVSTHSGAVPGTSGLHGRAKQAQRLAMNSTGLSSVPSDHLVPFTDQLRLAVAAHLAASRAPPGTTESDLRCYLACAHSTA
jgi:hypothetical protein